MHLPGCRPRPSKVRFVGLKNKDSKDVLMRWHGASMGLEPIRSQVSCAYVEIDGHRRESAPFAARRC